jgi:hypothetical protein
MTFPHRCKAQATQGKKQKNNHEVKHNMQSLYLHALGEPAPILIAW